MKLETLLSDLGTSLGLQDLGLNENGVCSLVFDGSITVNIEPETGDGSVVYIYGVLCNVPQETEDRDRLYSALLEAQLFGKGTQMLSFGLDADEKQVYLWKTMDTGKAEVKDIRHMIEVFCNVFDAWQNQVKNMMTTLDSADAAPGNKDTMIGGHMPGAIKA